MDENTRKIYEKYGIDPEQREKENYELIEKKYQELDETNLSIIKKNFDEGINNFEDLKNFIRDPHFYYFTELNSNIWQIVQCLMIKAYSASITLTNHVLERTLKLALIQNEVGIIPKKFDSWNEFYKPAHKYSKWDLNETISECKKLNLITEIHVETLSDYRKSLRNGFSHYDPNAILRDSNDIKEMTIHGNDPTENKTIELNFKEIPMLQNAYVNRFAEENAEIYFEFVFELIRHIEKQFKIKYWNEY